MCTLLPDSFLCYTGAYGRIVPLPVEYLEDGTLVVYSDVLGLELHVQPGLEEGVFRFVDPTTGRTLPNYDEALAAQEAAEELARREAARRQAAEARLAELEEQIRRMRDEG